MNDISLEDYIAVKAKFATFVPHTAGRYQKKRFRKAQCPIAERYCFCITRFQWNQPGSAGEGCGGWCSSKNSI